MNAVEIEEAISELAGQPFDRSEFPFAFLAAFGNKTTTIKRLRQPRGAKSSTNSSDIEGGVLQRTNIHMAVCDQGKVNETLNALRESPKTAKGKVKFILATDGIDFMAEDVNSGEPLSCAYADFANHFGFFLSLAGISTVREIKNNPIDIKATARLNKLYMELVKTNEDWAGDGRRQELNQFMARLIFCFFAEDTGIFIGKNLFTDTIEKMSESQPASGAFGNTHQVIETLFQAMDIKPEDRKAKGVKSWANKFPYVNGGLFTQNTSCPSFSRIARSYLLQAGGLDWSKINPDIFGSMIQAVADEDERGELGMHYTSVPNILKVLNPLFLDELRDCLDKAGDNGRKLLNLRKRIAAIRVFDPACGSGNFLVIAYRHMREIEAEIVKRRGEQGSKNEKSWIKLTNFYGIEIKSFAAEIARLALLIAEFQCNVRWIGQSEACLEVLPLNATGQIRTGNALRLDWLEVCPAPAISKPVEVDNGKEHDVAGDGRDVETETYICGNPPYKGYNKQTVEEKDDLRFVFEGTLERWGTLDYVAAWFMKASFYNATIETDAAFVATNTICQGGQVSILWPAIFSYNQKINFAHTSFKWANLASKNAGITVIIVGITKKNSNPTILITQTSDGQAIVHKAANINGYLTHGNNVYVGAKTMPISNVAKMSFGNHPYYGNALIFSVDEAADIISRSSETAKFIRPFYGSSEVIKGSPRMCIWVTDELEKEASAIPILKQRFDEVKKVRTSKLRDKTAQNLITAPHRFRDQFSAERYFIAVPQTSSENREYLPFDLIDSSAIVSFKCFALYDAPLWNMALIASRLHWVWIGTVCARLRNDYSYSNTLGWNTFPVPKLTQKQKNDLTECAQNILLAREAHFPATIADLYKPDAMPEDLRHAHERNDEVLERIYIGRRFKNDTERLEKLFDLYTKMTAKAAA